jgi:hypothetical protein
MFCPVIDSIFNRKLIVFIISSYFIAEPKGIVFLYFSINVSSLIVSFIPPGPIQFTSIPSFDKITAKCLVNPTNPCFEAVYAGFFIFPSYKSKHGDTTE